MKSREFEMFHRMFKTVLVAVNREPVLLLSRLCDGTEESVAKVAQVSGVDLPAPDLFRLLMLAIEANVANGYIECRELPGRLANGTADREMRLTWIGDTVVRLCVQDRGVVHETGTREQL